MTIRSKAFTMIEVTIAIALLAIIASLVTINVTQTRKTARDSIRKSDASALLAAVSQYSLANGSSFIRYPDSAGKPGTCSVSNATNPAIPATGNDCVGASGRAYGLVNMAGATLMGVGDDPSGSGTRIYPSHSIIEALKDGGYLNVDPKDPLNRVGKLGQNDLAVPDYALIRACPNGDQHVGERGQLYAVWVMLERNLSLTDSASLANVPGYFDANATGGYDFGASAFQTQFETTGFGVGNGPTKLSLGAQVGSCKNS